LRPPIAQDRRTLRPDGTVLVMLKTPWRDGTTGLHFGPFTLLERLAALTRRPRAGTPAPAAFRQGLSPSTASPRSAGGTSDLG
jgi:hypothetical protein